MAPAVYIYYAKPIFLDFCIGLSKLFDSHGIQNWIIDHHYFKDRNLLNSILYSDIPCITFYDTAFPKKLIFWNSEALSIRKDERGSDDFKGLSDPVTFWDYSRGNEEIVKEFNSSFRYMPFGYLPYFEECFQKRQTLNTEITNDLTEIKNYHRTGQFDILFYGHLNEKRTKILEDMENAGLSVCCPTKHVQKSTDFITNTRRDQLIANAKIVLSINRGTHPTNDLFRLNYLYANKVFVLCEDSTDSIIPELKELGAVFCKANEFVTVARWWLDHPTERLQQVEKTYQNFKTKFHLDNFIPYEMFQLNPNSADQ